MVATRCWFSWMGTLLCMVGILICAQPSPTRQQTASVSPPVTPTMVMLPTIVIPTMPPTPRSTILPRATSTVIERRTPRAARIEQPYIAPLVVKNTYLAYVPTVIKYGQSYPYSCEFDAGWIILQSYGINVVVDDLINAIPHDLSVAPAIVTSKDQTFIQGGNIVTMYSGDYLHDYLARTTGQAFAQVFHTFGLRSYPVHDARALRGALQRQELVWMKATVDFNPGVPAVWMTPAGEHIPTVVGNDHAIVVIGYDEHVVVIRDPLGPTSTNPSRPFEYEVLWDRFLKVWASQNFDAIAVERPDSLDHSSRE